MKFIKYFRIIGFLIATLIVLSCENNIGRETYIVKFETNGGTSIASYKSDLIFEVPYTKKDNFIFDGWYASADFTGECINFPYSITENVTLYAKWIQKNFCVTFETNGGTSINAYATDEIKESPVTIKEGYNFIGWYGSSDCSGDTILFPVKITKDVTFYAKWDKKDFLVSFETNGGSVVYPYQGDEIAESPVTIKSDFDFLGWYEAKDCSDNAIVFPYRITKDVVLHAKWSQKKFTVTFETNNGTEINSYKTNILMEKPETKKKGFRLFSAGTSTNC